MPDEAVGEASGSSAMDRMRALSFRISGRLNRITRVYLGPAQVDEGARANTVQPLSSSPCPICGKPMADHDLERTPGAKARFYCPEG
jgi:hypothetical protein